MELKPFSVKVNEEGYIFIFIFVVLTVILGFIWPPLGWICAILSLWCVSFFRDPDKVIPDNKNYILSPADGTIQKIAEVKVPSELGLEDTGTRIKISIFLSVFDIHINRIPYDGKIKKILYFKGKFFNAALDKASKYNERNYVVLTMANSKKEIIFTQIAGLIARRIVCNAKKGDTVEAGDRYGMIRFGSRTDIYLPKGEIPTVLEGQKVIGGETILSILGNKDPIARK